MTCYNMCIFATESVKFILVCNLVPDIISSFSSPKDEFTATPRQLKDYKREGWQDKITATVAQREWKVGQKPCKFNYVSQKS
jgi:hypothetical protein